MFWPSARRIHDSLRRTLWVLRNFWRTSIRPSRDSLLSYKNEVSDSLDHQITLKYNLNKGIHHEFQSIITREFYFQLINAYLLSENEKEQFSTFNESSICNHVQFQIRCRQSFCRNSKQNVHVPWKPEPNQIVHHQRLEITIKVLSLK